MVAICIIEALRSTDDAYIGFYIFCGVFFFIFGVLYAIAITDEYEEWEFDSKKEIVALSNNTETEEGGLLYVSVSAKNEYTYRYEINSTDTITYYKTNTILGNVIEMEDINCKVPELIVEKRKGKVTMWSLGLNTDIRYIFHVPYGTISHKIQ